MSAADWNAVVAELEALWIKEGKPRGAAWKRIAAPLGARQEAIETALAPVLMEWAETNGCGRYADGSGHFGLVGWWSEFGGYKKIREHFGIEMNGNILRLLLSNAGAARANADAERDLDDLARMPEDEWVPYMDGFCTTTPEGQVTKDYLLAARKRLGGAR